MNAWCLGKLVCGMLAGNLVVVIRDMDVLVGVILPRAPFLVFCHSPFGNRDHFSTSRTSLPALGGVGLLMFVSPHAFQALIGNGNQNNGLYPLELESIHRCWLKQWSCWFQKKN